MSEEGSARRIRIAVRNDYAVIVAGVAAMLSQFPERFEIEQLAVGAQASVEPVDITLYDTFSQTQIDGSDVDELLADPDIGRLVIFTWNVNPTLIQMATDKGVAGYLSKTIGPQELADSLDRIAAGEVVITQQTTRSGRVAGQWPGREFGLTAREAEVVSLITQGLSNEDIARRSFISINSVKSYIRTAYRKMGVVTRAQAVLWGVQHGMLPSRSRGVPSDADR